MADEEIHPWIGFTVRFLFGAALGALMCALWTVNYGEGFFVTPVLLAAILFGLAAAFIRDEFWSGIGEWLWWWR